MIGLYSTCRADKYLLEPIAEGLGEKLNAEGRPDIAILLGDRKETLNRAYQCVLNRVPIVHIHGGEETLNTYDNQFRHAITKLSNIHLVAHEDYRRRVIQMGEHPDTVFTVGSIGAELASKRPKEHKKETDVVICFNPATLEEHPEKQFDSIIEFMANFSKRYHIFMANNDHGSDKINKLIERCAETDDKSIEIIMYDELPIEGYHRILASSEFCIGNSSSFIFEAPQLKTPTIMVGDRQKGRLYGDSVFWAEPEIESIKNAIGRMRTAKIEFTNPHYRMGCVDRIVSIIKNLGQINIRKRFYDV